MNEKLETAIAKTVSFVLEKLNAGDGLSCLLRVDCDTGENMAVYILDNVEETIEMAHNELTSFYQNVEFYVIAYDGGWTDGEGIEHRAVIIELEHKLSESPRRLGLAVQVSNEGVLSPTGNVREFRSPNWSLFDQVEVDHD